MEALVCDITKVVRPPIKRYQIQVVELAEVGEGTVVASIDTDLSERGYAALLGRTAKMLHKSETEWTK